MTWCLFAFQTADWRHWCTLCAEYPPVQQRKGDGSHGVLLALLANRVGLMVFCLIFIAGCWSFLRLSGQSLGEASTVMYGSLAARYAFLSFLHHQVTHMHTYTYARIYMLTCTPTYAYTPTYAHAYRLLMVLQMLEHVHLLYWQRL